MTPQYYSKKKKTERLSFTITPALKHELNEFVEQMKKEEPNNAVFKSLSSFCYYSIKDILDIRKKGIDLGLINKIPDKKTKSFYDDITFRAIIPLFELGMALNKYNEENIKSPQLLFTFRKYILQDLKIETIEDLKIVVEKLKSFLVSNNLTKELRVDLYKIKNDNYLNGILEYIGTYKNLHYNNCKAMAGILGVFGIKIENLTLSDSDLYARFDLKSTDLLFHEDTYRKQRRKLLEHNVRFLTNYEKIINDKERYLWIKLSENKDIVINFQTPLTFSRLFEKILDDLKTYGDEESFLLNILKIFNNFHWISIEDEEQLSFRFKILNTKDNKLENSKNDLIEYVIRKYDNDPHLVELIENLETQKQCDEEELILETLNKYAHIHNEGDIYYLEKK